MSGWTNFRDNMLIPGGMFREGGWLNPKNPANAAMPYLEKIPPMLQEQFSPYQQQGQTAYGQMKDPLNAMTSDPAAFMEQMMKGYEPSRGFQMKKEEMLRAAGNSAAAGGMRGTMGDMKNEAQLTDMLMGEDMQQWLQNVMGIQGRGLAGQQNIYNQGYDASKSYAGDLSNLFGTQAGLQFQGQRERNQGSQDQIKALMQMLMAAAPMML